MTMTLPPLPYALDALAPHISKATLEAHHGHHHAAYIETTIALIRGTVLENAALEDIVRVGAKRTRKALFNASAQAWNHAFFWKCMKPAGGGQALGNLAGMIIRDFGSQESFAEQFSTTALSQFGGGWAWLVLDADRLRIVSTSNANTPLVTPPVPLLAIDVWEHAYYLDYQYRRVAYVAAFLGNLVNWEFVSENLERAMELRARALRMPDQALGRVATS